MFKSVDCVTQIVKLIYLFYKSGTDESSQDESPTDARRNVKCGRNGRKSKPSRSRTVIVRRVTANILGTEWVTSPRQDPEICLTATATVDDLNQKVCCVDKILKICRCRYEGHQTKIQNKSEMLRVRGTLHCTTNIVIIAPIFLSTLYEVQTFWPLSQISDC